MKNKKIIEIKDGAYLTDPCYNITTWCQQLLNNVKGGKWVVDYEFNDETEQVVLSLAHEDYGMDIFNNYDEIKDSALLGVDSGTIGIFDKKYYEKYHYNNTIDDSWYENKVCYFTQELRRGANIIDGKGVWVNTSYGDGEYIAQLYIKDNKVCGIEIVC